MSLPSKLTSPKTVGSVAVVCAGCAATQFVGEEGAEQILKEDINDVFLPRPVSLQENTCFSSMFAGVGPVAKNEKEISKEDELQNRLTVDFPGLSTDEQVNGCMSMRLSHDLSVPPTPFGAFNMGIVMKGEKAGGALYVDGIGGMSRPQTSDPNQEEVVQPLEEEPKYGQFLKYSLLLLAKDKEDIGNVKAGYSWKDNEISGHELKLYISDMAGDSIIDAKEYTSFHGGFPFNGRGMSDTDENSQPMLGQMELKGQKFNTPLVIGRKHSFKGSVDGGKLFLNEVYNLETKTGSGNTDDAVDLGRVLDDWYVPFMNKKGKGIQPESEVDVGDNQSDDESE